MAVRVDAEGDYVERDCEENSFRFHEIVALDDDRHHVALTTYA